MDAETDETFDGREGRGVGLPVEVIHMVVNGADGKTGRALLDPRLRFVARCVCRVWHDAVESPSRADTRRIVSASPDPARTTLWLQGRLVCCSALAQQLWCDRLLQRSDASLVKDIVVTRMHVLIDAYAPAVRAIHVAAALATLPDSCLLRRVRHSNLDSEPPLSMPVFTKDGSGRWVPKMPGDDDSDGGKTRDDHGWLADAAAAFADSFSCFPADSACRPPVHQCGPLTVPFCPRPDPTMSRDGRPERATGEAPECRKNRTPPRNATPDDRACHSSTCRLLYAHMVEACACANHPKRAALLWSAMTPGQLTRCALLAAARDHVEAVEAFLCQATVRTIDPLSSCASCPPSNDPFPTWPTDGRERSGCDKQSSDARDAGAVADELAPCDAAPSDCRNQAFLDRAAVALWGCAARHSAVKTVRLLLCLGDQSLTVSTTAPADESLKTTDSHSVGPTILGLPLLRTNVARPKDAPASPRMPVGEKTDRQPSDEARKHKERRFRGEWLALCNAMRKAWRAGRWIDSVARGGSVAALAAHAPTHHYDHVEAMHAGARHGNVAMCRWVAGERRGCCGFGHAAMCRAACHAAAGATSGASGVLDWLAEDCGFAPQPSDAAAMLRRLAAPGRSLGRPSLILERWPHLIVGVQTETRAVPLVWAAIMGGDPAEAKRIMLALVPRIPTLGSGLWSCAVMAAEGLVRREAQNTDDQVLCPDEGAHLTASLLGACTVALKAGLFSAPLVHDALRDLEQAARAASENGADASTLCEHDSFPSPRHFESTERDLSAQETALGGPESATLFETQRRSQTNVGGKSDVDLMPAYAALADVAQARADDAQQLWHAWCGRVRPIGACVPSAIEAMRRRAPPHHHHHHDDAQMIHVADLAVRLLTAANLLAPPTPHAVEAAVVHARPKRPWVVARKNNP